MLGTLHNISFHLCLLPDNNCFNNFNSIHYYWGQIQHNNLYILFQISKLHMDIGMAYTIKFNSINSNLLDKCKYTSYWEDKNPLNKLYIMTFKSSFDSDLHTLSMTNPKDMLMLGISYNKHFSINNSLENIKDIVTNLYINNIPPSIADM